MVATAWSGADILLRQGLQFAVTIALARLLSPEEFGIVALLSLFIGIASAFVDGGFSSALVQRQDVTHIDESTVFWFNLGMGALVGLGLWASSPLIAAFYDLPILKPLIAVMALNVLLGALGAIHGTLLTKQLDFRTQLKVGAIATVISGAVAVVMAWKGFGVWALVAQTLVMTTTTTLLLWTFHRWRPAWTFSPASAHRLFGFGGYMLAATLSDIAYNRLYTLLIGKFYGVRELGFYNRAEATKQLPGNVLTSILARVSFPMFSAAATDTDKLRRGTQLAVRGMMLLNAPMMLGLAALAEPLVLTLFGAKWLPAAPMLQVLCLAGVLWPLHVINLNVLMAQGHARLILRLEVAKKLIGVGLLVVGTYHGVMGIAWSQVAFSLLAFMINVRYTKRFLDYGARAQLRDFMPALVVAIAMAAVIHGLSFHWRATPAVELSVLTVFGALLFLLLGWLGRLAAMHDVVALFRRPAVDPGSTNAA